MGRVRQYPEYIPASESLVSFITTWRARTLLVSDQDYQEKEDQRMRDELCIMMCEGCEGDAGFSSTNIRHKTPPQSGPSRAPRWGKEIDIGDFVSIHHLSSAYRSEKKIRLMFSLGSVCVCVDFRLVETQHKKTKILNPDLCAFI